MNEDKQQQRRTAVKKFFDLEENTNQSNGNREVNFNLQELEEAAADIEQFLLQQKQKTNENIVESSFNTAADDEPRKE
ncbi:MAG: hypothetical protein N3E45_06675 [Oscillatoriaceae bacterium SKW80]|nr:hypothetical protein [Oscillatoriaceae bacterium SKYG93]MCX8120501.1 hypothetical protein [Oscillatoriaceae bacterium SKW80]MDW8452739.1 hypothetical protein [Oscillatoriaceae cyanobacterium SKYGB_i_bin93]HIK27191.1 hypothetical protein [Oscillatoriaceae cyanobacterium M7585_C2015_266]